MKDTIENLFESIEGDFDINETPSGHQKRFLEKLHDTNAKRSSKNTWLKPLSIAASIVLIMTIGFLSTNDKVESGELASVSPEMEKTQSFFTTTINQELQILNSYDTPEAKNLAIDALRQIAVLEQQYELLKNDLTSSGNDNRVIYAMISNFQSRIEVLEHVISTIEDIKTLKLNQDETIL